MSAIISSLAAAVVTEAIKNVVEASETSETAEVQDSPSQRQSQCQSQSVDIEVNVFVNGKKYSSEKRHIENP